MLSVESVSDVIILSCQWTGNSEGVPILSFLVNTHSESGNLGQHNQNDYSSQFGLKPRVSRIT